MGRHGIVERHLAIDVNELNRLGAFRRATAEFPHLAFRLPCVSQMTTNWSSITIQFMKDRRWQSIPVRWTHCNFGGQRPWLECPCGRRVGKLYDSGFCFGCRQCLNLIYECQRRGPNISRYLRVCKLREDCGGSSSILEPFPNRPRGMRKKTYLRLRSRAESLERDLRKRPRFMKRAQHYAREAQYRAFSR
jgi:hypothetical protein